MFEGQNAAVLADELVAECLSRADRHRELAASCAGQLRGALDAAAHAPVDSAWLDSLRAAQAEHEAAEASLRFIATWLASGEEYALEAEPPPPAELAVYG